MPRLDLDDLRLFRFIAEAGSITAGAARAHLALAAASARVRGMEAALGVRLFDRSRQGVTMTPAGETLLTHARTLLAQADRMHEEMSFHAGAGAGHIRLLSNTNALAEFLPDILGRFLASAPATTVDLRERLSDEITGLIAEGVADIGIVASTADTGALETFPFRSDRFVLVVANHHPFAGRPAIAFKDVLDQDFVGLDQASAIQRLLADRAAREGRRLRLRVQLRGFDAVCRVVEAGVGVGIVPETTAKRAMCTMALTAIPLADRWATRDIRICVRSLAALPDSARRLVELLRSPSPA